MRHFWPAGMSMLSQSAGSAIAPDASQLRTEWLCSPGTPFVTACQTLFIPEWRGWRQCMQACVRFGMDGVSAREQWEQLNRQCPPEEVHGLVAMLQAWIACADPGKPLPLICASAEDQTAALLAAQQVRRRIRGIELRILQTAGNEHWRPGAPVLGHNAELSVAALLQGLLKHSGWDMLELGPILEGSEALKLLLERGGRLGLAPSICSRSDDPVVILEGTWEDYYAKLSGNLRSQVKRGEAKLRKQGELALEEYRGGEDLDQRLEEFFRTEASGWKGREGTAILSSEWTRRFYTELARQAHPRDQLRLYFLRLDGACVAADYCIAHGGTVSMLKVGYDESFAPCSPGQVMRKFVLEHLFRQQEDRIYDMMSGGGDHGGYKPRWANHVRQCVTVRLFNPGTVRGRIAAGASRVRQWLNRGATPNPPLAEVAAGD